jgi:hypothetical protein
MIAWVQHVTVLMLTWAPGLAAQTSSSSPGEATALLVGPVVLSPTIVLRDIGFDSNVRNESDDPKQDFTLTAQPRVRAAVPFGSTQLTGSVTLGFVYYARYKSEQSINRLYEGRFEGTTSRLRPFFAAAFNHTRERGGYEIDARVLRRETNVSAGAELKLTPVTSLTGFYRRVTQNYGDEARFLGTALAGQLDQATDVASGGLRLAMTPLTTVFLDVERQRDRFDRSTLRDADSVRVLPGVEFAPTAVITGRVAAGFRHFNPLDPRVEPFHGLVASANVAGTFLGATRVSVEANRDVMYSFDPATPTYLLTSGRLMVSQRIAGPFDAIAVAGRDRLQYFVVEGLPLSGRIDRTRTIGAGAGYHLSPSLRLAVIYDVTERSSEIDRNSYDRRRLFGSVTYER